MDDPTIRRGGPADVEPAIAVWRAANTARRGGRRPSPEQEARSRGHVRKPDAFLVVADAAGEVVGMRLAVRGSPTTAPGHP